MRWILRVAFIFVLLIIVAQFFLPGTVATAMEKALHEQWQLQEVQVKVHAFPAVKILTGKVDKAEIFISETVFGMVPINDLYMELLEININVISVLQKDFNYEMQRAGTVEFKITEEGLNKYLQENPIGGLNNVSVELNEDLSKVKSQITILGTKVDFTLLGRFALKDENLVFVPEDFKVDEHSLGELFKDRIETGTNLAFNLGTLPYDTKLNRLETGVKTITFYGTIGFFRI